MKYFVGAEHKYLLLGLAVVSVLTYLAAVYANARERLPSSSERLAVCLKLEHAQEVLKRERRRLGIPLSPDDKLATGWIGLSESILTTDPGSLKAKRSLTNPNIGAAVVDLLVKAGVTKGSVVAIGMTGSFPAFDAAVIIAAEELGARPIIISSVGASQWGANEPGFTWQVMEKSLYDAQIIHHRSTAVTRGGSRNLPPDTIKALEKDATVSGATTIDDDHIVHSIRQRMRIYTREAGGRPIVAFINVGGAVANVGMQGVKNPKNPVITQGVLGTFRAQSVQVVDLRRIRRFCRQNGLPWDPQHMPKVGVGKLFERRNSLPVVVGLCLVVQLAAILVVSRAWTPRDGKHPLDLGEVIRPE